MIACVRETRDEGNVRVRQERMVVCVRESIIVWERVGFCASD